MSGIKVWEIEEEVNAEDLNRNFSFVTSIANITAGETMTGDTTPVPVYISESDGKAYKGDASDVTKTRITGFAVTDAIADGEIAIRGGEIIPGFSGLTAGAIYYLQDTAGTIGTTPGTNPVAVGVALSSTILRFIENSPLKIVRTYTPNTPMGGSTTQFDITNTSGSTYRYTWDSTGTDPSINSDTLPIGSVITIKAQNFSSGNNGTFLVTGVGSNYFEVTNASGVVESNKTLGTGYLQKGHLWTRPTGLKYIEVEVQAAGGGTTAGSGAGAGAYAKKMFTYGALSATEMINVGYRGTGSSSTATKGTDSLFGSVVCTGGLEGSSRTGGTATGGDININGQDGQASMSIDGVNVSGEGGDSFLGKGGRRVTHAASSGGSTAGNTGFGYGAGASGGASGSNAATGANGTNGIVIVTEYY